MEVEDEAQVEAVAEGESQEEEYEEEDAPMGQPPRHNLSGWGHGVNPPSPPQPPSVGLGETTYPQDESGPELCVSVCLFSLSDHESSYSRTPC